tara:strand:- start:56057 stop:57208 length:1152 start_codon:yes stop_codon:yes gene_type:complete
MNNAFCILAWVGLHTTPDGNVYPCCAADMSKPWGNINSNNLTDIYNNDKFKGIRTQMLEGNKVEECNLCYNNEKFYGHSQRLDSNEGYNKDIALVKQNIDPKIQYLDVRFSNICNMKCRMCNSGYSSLWGQEEKSRGNHVPSYLHVKKEYLDNILELLPNVDHIYFAGGEPLIMDEHYIILEEIQRLGLANKIHIRYSTNLSVVQYKKKDLLDLWKGFRNIDLAASIDHYGERAEYIRHGTNWNDIEENIKKLQTVDNVELSISSTVNVFNYVTYIEFLSYMKDYFSNVKYISMYPMHTPEYMTSQVLPIKLKTLGTNRLKKFSSIGQNRFANDINNLIKYANHDNQWDMHKVELLEEIKLRDKIRGEDFAKTFPELKDMLDD